MAKEEVGSDPSGNNELNPPDNAFTKGFGYLFGILLSIILAEYITNGLAVLSGLFGITPSSGIKFADMLSVNPNFIIFLVVFIIGLIIILNQTIETFLWTLSRPDRFDREELKFEIAKFMFHLLGIIALYGYVAVFTNIGNFPNEFDIFISMAAMFFFMNLFFASWCVIYELQNERGEDGWRENRLAFWMNVSYCILWIMFIIGTVWIPEPSNTLGLAITAMFLIGILLSYQIMYLLLWGEWYVVGLLGLSTGPG